MAGDFNFFRNCSQGSCSDFDFPLRTLRHIIIFFIQCLGFLYQFYYVDLEPIGPLEPLNFIESIRLIVPLETIKPIKEYKTQET